MFLYSVFDVVLDEFAPPFVAKNDKAASRMFLQAIKKMSNINDMSLWKVGNFVPDGKPVKENVDAEYDVVYGCVPVQIPIEVNGSDE